ncbi:hypothetical protein NM688_g8485 [Phlebia brevispora]|uniref:Uncharacterized protein n=1 Tax=Phlebia brevispora TaxID=194682 RepID=A0ACC1RTI3_9APHY|nr:hypothetical protein NM688_g8485 [Phlebia brevispora]
MLPGVDFQTNLSSTNVVSSYGVITVGDMSVASVATDVLDLSDGKGFVSAFGLEVSKHRCWARELDGKEACIISTTLNEKGQTQLSVSWSAVVASEFGSAGEVAVCRKKFHGGSEVIYLGPGGRVFCAPSSATCMPKASRARKRKAKASETQTEEQYEVEVITKARLRDDGVWEYLVKVRFWAGYDPEDDSWEPYENVKGCVRLLESFKRETKLDNGNDDRKRCGYEIAASETWIQSERQRFRFNYGVPKNTRGPVKVNVQKDESDPKPEPKKKRRRRRY